MNASPSSTLNEFGRIRSPSTRLKAFCKCTLTSQCIGGSHKTCQRIHGTEYGKQRYSSKRLRGLGCPKEVSYAL